VRGGSTGLVLLCLSACADGPPEDSDLLGTAFCPEIEGTERDGLCVLDNTPSHCSGYFSGSVDGCATLAQALVNTNWCVDRPDDYQSQWARCGSGDSAIFQVSTGDYSGWGYGDSESAYFDSDGIMTAVIASGHEWCAVCDNEYVHGTIKGDNPKDCNWRALSPGVESPPCLL